MENAEEVFHFLEEFSKRKPKTIPQELNDYLAYVARTGDPVYQWSLVKCLFKEKFLNVITDFYETSPGIDIPTYPNVDPFNYDIMKNSLLERLDSFTSAPFTVQRICELLTYPRKQYNRIDKFMRAIEKNILVVSTREPGPQRHIEADNGEQAEPMVNGSDNNSDYNVDVEMEDMSWKENAEQQNAEPQPGSSDAHITVDDIEARLQAKKDTSMDTQDKTTTQYESVTPPELNIAEESTSEAKAGSLMSPETSTSSNDKPIVEVNPAATESPMEPKEEIEIKTVSVANTPLIIPEIKVDDAEMTEQRLNEELIKASKNEEDTPTNPSKIETPVVTAQASIDENSSDSTTKEEREPKLISEVSTSSEESSSSSDNTDGNSNSPKTDSDAHIDVQEESSEPDGNLEAPTVKNDTANDETDNVSSNIPPESSTRNLIQDSIQTDNYSISDVNSEIPQTPPEVIKTEPCKDEEIQQVAPQNDTVETKCEETESVSENIVS